MNELLGTAVIVTASPNLLHGGSLRKDCLRAMFPRGTAVDHLWDLREVVEVSELNVHEKMEYSHLPC
jgi:hypothetical protein